MSKTSPALREAPLPTYDVVSGEQPFSWLHAMAETIRDHMLVHGAVLIHGLPIDGPDGIVEARRALGIRIHTPAEAFNHRKDFGNGVVSPISWPADRPLCPFQESSFSTTYPSVVLTACVTPPDGDGEAYLSDARRIADHLPVGLVDRVRRDGWIMTRVFHDGFGISWREAFSVAGHAELDEMFEAAGITSRWLPVGALHTARHRPGVMNHPETGEECWFNQISFLNAGVLDPAERAIMAESFGEDLPMNTFFGDGSSVLGEDLTALEVAYEAVKIGVPWRRGDLLIADNMIMAQGRSRFGGSPEILVALGEGFNPVAAF